MSNKWVSSGGYYVLLSTDIASGSWVEGAGDDLSFIGAPVIATDTGDMYRVTARHTLTKVAQQVSLTPDLALDASNVTIVLANSIGTAAVPDTARVLGFYTSSSSIRLGFESPAVLSGSATGSAVALTDWKKGVPIKENEWNWFAPGKGVSRTLYFRSGSPADTIQITQM